MKHVFWFLARNLNPPPINYQVKSATNSTKSSFVIIPIILGIYHHATHSIYNQTKIHNLINIQVAHTGLEPKSSHTIKYSQPLELVLFHVKVPHINYFKCSYYPS